MKHKIGFNRLDRMPAHRKAMVKNMMTSLFRYERIITTKSKALEIRRFAEKAITRAKEDSVHNRRIVAKKIQDEAILAKLFKDIGPRMKERAGGYTRILKLSARKNDAAALVILELVDYKLDSDVVKQKDDKKVQKKAKKEAEAKKEAGASTKA